MASAGEALDHECRWSQRLIWGEWRREGTLRIREARRVSVCSVCGAVRAVRVPRPVIGIEREAASPEVPPIPDGEGRRIARAILSRASGATGDDPADEDAGRRPPRVAGVPGSTVEEWLDVLMRAGFVRLGWRVRGGREECDGVVVLSEGDLREYVEPGERAALLAAIAGARSAVEGLSHPVTEDVKAALDEAASEGMDARVVRALAAVAAHADSGEILASRVFSARFLGDSKDLSRIRGRVERVVGPLEALGIRDGGAIVLVGGAGVISCGESVIRLNEVGPFLGVPAESACRVAKVGFPPDGVLVVENLAPFEACCRGEVDGAGDPLVVWSAGYPGRGVRAIVEQARESGATIRVWADLDLDGVRIARLVASWAGPGCRFFRMSRAEVESAAARLPLSQRAARAIRADIEAHPDARLSDLLAALLVAGCWIEQEALLGSGRRNIEM